MIRYGNLLQNHRAFSVFWKTILERLSLADAPFSSSIQADALQIRDARIRLAEPPERVVEFCRQQWSVPHPHDAWKDIKKEHTRLLLLRDFLARNAIGLHKILELQMLIGDKVITSDDIVFSGGRIIDIKGFEV